MLLWLLNAHVAVAFYHQSSKLKELLNIAIDYDTK